MKRVAFLSVFLMGSILGCSQFSIVNSESIPRKDEHPYKAVVCTPSGNVLKSVFDGLKSPPGFQFSSSLQLLNTRLVVYQPIGATTGTGLRFIKSGGQPPDCTLQHCDQRCGYHYSMTVTADCQGWCGVRQMGDYYNNYCSCIKYCYCSCAPCSSYAAECECWDCGG